MKKKELLRKLYVLIPTFFSDIYNKAIFTINRVQLGEHFTSRGRIKIKRVFAIPFLGRHQIFIGNNVRINSSLMADPVSFAGSTIFYVNKRGRIEIQSDAGLSNAIVVAHDANVVIGKEVMIGAGVKIYTTDFHSVDFEDRIDHVNTKSGNVWIKDGAFIGADSLILKNVTIGEKSVIAANSVVTKDVPDLEIWGGNPAKFIRKLEKR